MRLCGIDIGPCRLPLCPIAPENENKLKNLLMEFPLAQYTFQHQELFFFRIQNKALDLRGMRLYIYRDDFLSRPCRNLLFCCGAVTFQLFRPFREVLMHEKI